ncbi:MAG: 30S ribosome-binding factor RbfA [bacterium]|nr:30S ribosome-binding factor RbfA [bacterium]MCP5070093.1 30S ribosome-binding factor RbfA [bacterium]
MSEEIRGELARLLHEEITDPRIELVTITRVDLSPDFRNARIDWSRMGVDGDHGEADPEVDQATQEGLESASGFLRRRLAHTLPIKRVPELRFHHDGSLALGAHTLGLIAEVSDGEE